MPLPARVATKTRTIADVAPHLWRVCFFYTDPGASHQTASHFVLCPWLPSLAAVAAFFYLLSWCAWIRKNLCVLCVFVVLSSPIRPKNYWLDDSFLEWFPPL